MTSRGVPRGIPMTSHGRGPCLRSRRTQAPRGAGGQTGAPCGAAGRTRRRPRGPARRRGRHRRTRTTRRRTPGVRYSLSWPAGSDSPGRCSRRPCCFVCVYNGHLRMLGHCSTKFDQEYEEEIRWEKRRLQREKTHLVVLVVAELVVAVAVHAVGALIRRAAGNVRVAGGRRVMV